MKKNYRFKVYEDDNNIFDIKTNNLKEAKKKMNSIFDKFI